MTENDIERVNQIPICDIMDNYGIEYKKKGNKAFCSIRQGDKTPSCCLYLDTNTWCDFGDANRGGTVIHLVQKIENLSWREAVEKLADQWNIVPEKVSEKALPSEYEFREINIAPDRATKNFDFDTEKYDLKKTAEFSEKYAMPVYELEKLYPKVYHNMLRARAVPYLVEERNFYYSNIFSQYHLAKELGANGLNQTTTEELEKQAQKLNRLEKTLSRAITRSDFLKYTPRKYNVNDDLSKILNGTIQIENGNQTYIELKKAAAKQKKELLFKEMPYEDWINANEHIPDDIPYAAFINAKNDTVNFISFEENNAAVNYLFEKPKKEKTVTSAKAPTPDKKYNTVVVNLFGGPGAGKTGCAWEIAAALKKQGMVVEYVPEVAKEYVWENNLEILDGSLKNQSQLFEKQDWRVQRLMGQVEAIVTDSPILLNNIYLKEENSNFKKEVLQRFSSQRNFNVVVRRGKSFEKAGRIHDREQAAAIDERIENLLKENDFYYGKYTYAQITQCVENIQKSVAKANEKKFKDIAAQQNPIQKYCNQNYKAPAQKNLEILR